MWTKVVIEGQVLSLKTFLFSRGSYENVLFSSKCSHFSLVYMQFVACSQPQQSRSLTRQESFLKEKSLFAGKVLPTHLFPNNKLYSFSVPEKAIGGLYWNTKAAMADGWWLTPKFLWFIWILWFTIWLYYVPAPLVLSVILQLQLFLSKEILAR